MAFVGADGGQASNLTKIERAALDLLGAWVQTAGLPTTATERAIAADRALQLAIVFGQKITEWENGMSNSFMAQVDVGSIIAWSGQVEDIPTGWALCNGAGGTPDLDAEYLTGTVWIVKTLNT